MTRRDVHVLRWMTAHARHGPCRSGSTASFRNALLNAHRPRHRSPSRTDLSLVLDRRFRRHRSSRRIARPTGCRLLSQPRPSRLPTRKRRRHPVRARERRLASRLVRRRVRFRNCEWLHAFGEAIGDAIERGAPVIGGSLCRIVERPAWEDPRHWRARRVWDALLAQDEEPRAANSAYGQARRDLRARIDPLLTDPQRGRQVRS